MTQIKLCMNPGAYDAPQPKEPKVIKSKVNTGISKNKGKLIKQKSQKHESSPKYKPDSSPKEKLEQDLQRIKKQMSNAQKSGIQDYIDTKYAHLEQAL